MSETKDMTGNPAPLGLVAFGMTTVLLNLHNIGTIELSSMILAMGIFYGGLAQLIVGMMEWRKGNTFGTTAFASFGLFWISFVTLLILPKTGLGIAATPEEMAWFLALWGVFTLMMFFGTLRTTRALQFVFGSLAVLFFMLALADATGSDAIKVAAGAIGLVCGASAIYTGMAQVLNESNGKVMLPLFPVTQKATKEQSTSSEDQSVEK
ncbi:MAG: acetate uptake transporter [Euryarchaeota archaeon]|nr:acetate uptake transporter [Euryarchaeota archaeon]